MNTSKSSSEDLLHRSLETGEDCWAPADLHAAAIGDLGPLRQDELRAHLASCPSCAAEWRLARHFEDPSAAESLDPVELERIVRQLKERQPRELARPPAKVLSIARWAGSSAVLKLAAAVLVVFAGSVWLRQQQAPPPLPESVPTSTQRGSRIEATAPRGEIPAAPDRLIWEPFPQAAAYTVSILGADLEPLWTASTTEPPLEVPSGLAHGLHPGVVYYWTVEALDATQQVVARSEATRFLILR